MSQFDSQFEENLYKLRQEKLQQIADLARSADASLPELAAKYPNAFAFTHTVPELRAVGDPKSTEELEVERVEASIAGRVMAIRVQGKAGFAQVQQGGQRLQIYVRKDDVGETAFAIYKLLDLGDIVGVSGYLMRTRTGELTLHVKTLQLLTKAMLALPDKYHGLEDVELRYRQRYVDLIMNSGGRTLEAAPVPGTSADADAAEPNAEHEEAPVNVREVFVKRAAVLRALRKFFDARGYLEVETPMLHTVAGGAAARPFTTHHNALDIPLSLRIAPELYLKRLVVGGLDRVYEINRNFRNEGVSTRHNPEFTMLEFYQAYANYHDLMDLTEELIKFVAMEVNGTTVTHFPVPTGVKRTGEPVRYESVEIDLANWKRLSMREAIIEFWPKGMTYTPVLEDFSNVESFSRMLIANSFDADENNANEFTPETLGRFIVGSLGLLLRKQFDAGEPMGKLIATLFENVAESHLIQPTIIYDFPLAVSPLSKIKPEEPEWTERFEFYIGGFEVGNAFSELNDAQDQRGRFAAQVEDKDPESMAEIDEDYVRALGYGLPPTAGEGIGIDRLTMLLTGSRSIRDVILFPLMRPVAKGSLPEGEAGESAE